MAVIESPNNAAVFAEESTGALPPEPTPVIGEIIPEVTLEMTLERVERKFGTLVYKIPITVAVPEEPTFSTLTMSHGPLITNANEFVAVVYAEEPAETVSSRCVIKGSLVSGSVVIRYTLISAPDVRVP